MRRCGCCGWLREGTCWEAEEGPHPDPLPEYRERERRQARAQMRVIIKRILRKYGYPPDKQARATELVLEQAEVLCREWGE